MQYFTKISMKTNVGFTSRNSTVNSAKSADFSYKYCTLIYSPAHMQGMQGACLCTTHMTVISYFVALPVQ